MDGWSAPLGPPQRVPGHWWPGTGRSGAGSRGKGRAPDTQGGGPDEEGRRPPPEAGPALRGTGTHLRPPARVGTPGDPPHAAHRRPQGAVTPSPPRRALTSGLPDQQGGAAGQNPDGTGISPRSCVRRVSGASAGRASCAVRQRIFWSRHPSLGAAELHSARLPAPLGTVCRPHSGPLSFVVL